MKEKRKPAVGSCGQRTTKRQIYITSFVKGCNNKTHIGSDFTWRLVRNRYADRHPEGIRLHSAYTNPQLAENLFIFAGVKVLRGAVAGRLLKGGRA